ncbi:Iojap-related, mitochondrial-like protein [Drosera capensis]
MLAALQSHLHPHRPLASLSSLLRRGFASQAPEILKLEEIEKVLADVKADDVRVVPVGDICDWADFMVFATGRSDWHVKNIAQAIMYKAGYDTNVWSGLAKQKQKGAERMLLPSIEGQQGGKWIVVDSGTVIVHALDEKARAYYDLESHWVSKNLAQESGEELDKALVKVRRINNSKKKVQQKTA